MQTRPPRTAREAYEWAQSAFRGKDFEGAISICRQILEVVPDSIPAFDLLATSLDRLDRIGEEIDALKSAIGSAGESSRLYAKLGELQRFTGDHGEAIVSLNRAAALDHDNALIRFRLGRTCYEKGDLVAAKLEFQLALEAGPRAAPVHYYLGNIHWKTGKWRAAREAYSTALELDADYIPAWVNFAKLLFQQKNSEDRAADLEQAAGLIRHAIAKGAVNFESCLLAGKILVELERSEEAREILETADKFTKKHPDLYVALSVTYNRLKDIEKSRDVSRRLMREFPVGSRRCASAETQVLVLSALYDSVFAKPDYGSQAYANSNTIGALPPDRVSLHHIYIQAINWDEIKSFVSKYDVIYNNVVNAEINIHEGYSEKVQYIIDRSNLPVVNPPDLVDLTTRDNNYERLHKLDHMIFPKTLAVDLSTEKKEEIVERVVSAFEFPILVRRAGRHRSFELEMVDGIAALRDSLARFAQGPCYIIQYHESIHHSGNFLMYRGVFNGRKFFPARMYLSDNWLVSGPSQRKLDKTLIESSSDFQDEEKRWLADPAGTIGEANIAALYALDNVVGLDNYGMDFGIAGDGRMIVFETNPCMNCLAIRRHVPKFPYLRQASDNIKSALEDLLIDKARGRG